MILYLPGTFSMFSHVSYQTVHGINLTLCVCILYGTP